MTSAYESGEVPEIQVHHRLRIAREWAHLEQAELAEKMGISRQSVMESAVVVAMVVGRGRGGVGSVARAGCGPFG